MTAISLAITYAEEAQASVPALALEQVPVADNGLTTEDLAAMLALVRAGYSAKTYRPRSCPASVVDGRVVVPLHVWAWPVPIDLPYVIAANQGDLAAPVLVEVEREFDVVFDFVDRVTLPFAVRSVAWEWTAMPCFDRLSNEVPRPAVTVDGNTLTLGDEVLAVLRVRCVAVGYLHALTLRIGKGTNAITDVEAVVSAGWRAKAGAQATELQLDLPGCVDLLLASCADGSLVAEAHGSVRDDTERVAVVYYNDCTGAELAVRYERP